MAAVKPYLLGIGVLLVLAGAGLGFYSWLQAHDAQIVMQYTLKEKDAQIAQREKENQDLRQKIATQPIQQVVKYIPQIVKVPAGTPEPVIIPVPNQLTPEEVKNLPDAPSTLIPDTTVRLLTSQAADSLACRDELKAERVKTDAAVRAAHGGGFWKRLKSNAHMVILGGALGAVVTVAIKH